MNAENTYLIFLEFEDRERERFVVSSAHDETRLLEITAEVGSEACSRLTSVFLVPGTFAMILDLNFKSGVMVYRAHVEGVVFIIGKVLPSMH